MIDIVSVYFHTAEIIFRDNIKDVFRLDEDVITDIGTLILLSYGIDSIRKLLPIYGLPHRIEIESVYV